MLMVSPSTHTHGVVSVGQVTAHWPPTTLNVEPTCQCCVTAFHTPTFPVWLVATSWFPMKKRWSTGTPRLKTPGAEWRVTNFSVSRGAVCVGRGAGGTSVTLTDLVPTAPVLDTPQDDAALRGCGHHLVLVSMWSSHHLSIQCNTFNGPREVGGGKHLLPSRRLLYPATTPEGALLSGLQSFHRWQMNCLKYFIKKCFFSPEVYWYCSNKWAAPDHNNPAL